MSCATCLRVRDWGKKLWHVLQVVELPAVLHEGRFEQRAYLLVGPAGAGGAAPATRLLPDTPAARRLLRGAEHALRFWRANSTTGAHTEPVCKNACRTEGLGSELKFQP